LGDVYTCHGFLSKMGKLEKVDSKTFFNKIIEGFANGGFDNPWEPPFNRIYGTE